ncbi:MAG: ankyrin repeat domain-containing protein [Sphingobacteriia bacterium]|nr:ankyrin repeat domain-containing protein [Sphingobacteriia bacterium]
MLNERYNNQADTLSPDVIAHIFDVSRPRDVFNFLKANKISRDMCNRRRQELLGSSKVKGIDPENLLDYLASILALNDAIFEKDIKQVKKLFALGCITNNNIQSKIKEIKTSDVMLKLLHDYNIFDAIANKDFYSNEHDVEALLNVRNAYGLTNIEQQAFYYKIENIQSVINYLKVHKDIKLIIENKIENSLSKIRKIIAGKSLELIKHNNPHDIIASQILLLEYIENDDAISLKKLLQSGAGFIEQNIEISKPKCKKLFKEQKQNFIKLDALLNVKNLDSNSIKEFILNNGISINAYIKNLLLNTTWDNYSNNEILKILFNIGRNYNIKDKCGQTPLHSFAKDDINVNLVDYWLGEGSAKNPKDINSQTPLHIAVAHNSLKNIKSLVKSGANIYTKNNKGKTPLLIALNQGNEEIVKYFNEVIVKEKQKRISKRLKHKTVIIYKAKQAQG